jgi:enolase
MSSPRLASEAHRASLFGTVEFQEHIIVPDTESIGEALEMAELVGARLESIIRETYGPEAAASMGDEGGYVIPEDKYDEPFKLLARAIEETGFAGRIRLATDVAASSFFMDGMYQLGGTNIDADALASRYRELVTTYPILSIEDPFEEHDIASFTRLQSSLDLRVVGDDLTTTSAARITAAADVGAMHAVIIKPNQIGTLSETLDAMQAARKRDIDCIVSHRSGETMDDFIADLAYAFGVFGIKGGSPRRPDRPGNLRHHHRTRPHR